MKQVKAFGDITDAVRVKSKVTDTKVAEIKCESCGNVIKGMGQYGPEFVANKNKERYGKCLCIECGKKAQAELDAKASAPAEETADDLAAQLMADAER